MNAQSSTSYRCPLRKLGSKEAPSEGPTIALRVPRPIQRQSAGTHSHTKPGLRAASAGRTGRERFHDLQPLQTFLTRWAVRAKPFGVNLRAQSELCGEYPICATSADHTCLIVTTALRLATRIMIFTHATTVA